METMTQRILKLFPQVHAIKFNIIQSTATSWEETIELSPRLQGKTYVTNLLNQITSGNAYVENEPNTNLRMISTNNPVVIITKIIEGMNVNDLNKVYSSLNEIEKLIKDKIEYEILINN